MLIPVVGPLVMMLVNMLWDVLRWVVISVAVILAFGAGLYRMLNAGQELNPDCGADEACFTPSSLTPLPPSWRPG